MTTSRVSLPQHGALLYRIINLFTIIGLVLGLGLSACGGDVPENMPEGTDIVDGVLVNADGEFVDDPATPENEAELALSWNLDCQVQNLDFVVAILSVGSPVCAHSSNEFDGDQHRTAFDKDDHAYDPQFGNISSCATDTSSGEKDDWQYDWACVQVYWGVDAPQNFCSEYFSYTFADPDLANKAYHNYCE